MDLAKLNPFRKKTQYAAEHQILDRLVNFITTTNFTWYGEAIARFPGREALFSSKRAMARMICAYAERARHDKPIGAEALSDANYWLRELVRELAREKPEFEDDELVELALRDSDSQGGYRVPRDILARLALAHYKRVGRTPGSIRVVEAALSVHLRAQYPDAEDRQNTFRLQQAARGFDENIPPIIEDWQLPFGQLSYLDLSIIAWRAKSAKPTAKWLKEARTAVAEFAPEELLPRFEASLEHVRKMEVTGNPIVGDQLRGLCLMLGMVDHPAVPALLGQFLIASGHKLSGLGPRAPKAFGACLYALAELNSIDALTQLARAQSKIVTTNLQTSLRTTIQEAATKRGVTVAELEELVVPTFGLADDGTREWEMDDLRAKLTVGPDGVTVEWSRDGKPLKSKPTLTAEHKDVGTEITKLKKEIEASLTAQRIRIESQFLHERILEYPTWRERYLDHPLLRGMVRRLIWRFTDERRDVLGIWDGDGLVDAEGHSIEGLDEETKVQIWHPLDVGIAAVEAWREYLVTREIVQPFKQAHREVYILTDAERRTARYSNRFAAHVLRQHQCAALMRQRGWRVQLQGYFDSTFPTPAIRLEDHGLIAEFFVEVPDPGTGPENTYMTEAGIATYVLTDQVRFLDLRGETQPIENIPPKVFSEVMRDVDLFVGVCSIGNDPTWADHGEFSGYWRQFAFSPDLSTSALTRKAVLERLLPRLAFGSVSQIEGNYLVVRGKIRSYRIHLGSGNILMTPNDQYLCIVPSSRGEKHVPYLPFEGDGTLAVIISKALLLMNDDKITDPSITSQIRLR